MSKALSIRLVVSIDATAQALQFGYRVENFPKGVEKITLTMANGDQFTFTHYQDKWSDVVKVPHALEEIVTSPIMFKNGSYDGLPGWTQTNKIPEPQDTFFILGDPAMIDNNIKKIKQIKITQSSNNFPDSWELWKVERM